MDKYPDGNPKTQLGVTRVPLNLVPPSAKHYLAEAFADGAMKYGPYNWRGEAVSASIYYAAAQRHMDAWWDGEDLSQDAKVHHLGHAMANMAILLDAMTVGAMKDDRPARGAAANLQQAFAENGKKSTSAAQYTADQWKQTYAEGMPIMLSVEEFKLLTRGK